MKKVNWKDLDFTNQVIMLNLYNLQLDMADITLKIKHSSVSTEEKELELFRENVRLYNIQTDIADILKKEY